MNKENGLSDRVFDKQLSEITFLTSQLSPFVFLIGDYVNFISKSKIFFLNDASGRIVSIYYLWSFFVSFIFCIATLSFLYLLAKGLTFKEFYAKDLIGLSMISKRILQNIAIYIILFAYYTATSSSNNLLNFLEKPYHCLLPTIIPFILSIFGKIAATLISFIFLVVYIKSITRRSDIL